jgi:protein-arginine deiminase
MGVSVRALYFGWSMGLALVFSFVGCGPKAAQEAGGSVDENTVDDTGGSGGDAPPPDPGDAIVVETTLGPIFAAYPDLGVFPGLVGVPNLDDDDEMGGPDWDQEGQAAGDNDFAFASVETQGRDVGLSLQGEGLRIYSGDSLILGDGSAAQATISGVDSADLRVEFSDFLVQGLLTVTDVERGGSFEIALTASPLFFNHHLQAAEMTMAASIRGWGYDNDEFIEGYEDTLGNEFNRMIGGRYDNDPWVQDEFEFGYATSPDAHLDVIFDTHRNGQGAPGDGLDDFPEDEYEGPDWLLVNWGPRNAYSVDYGGNFEISPPVTVDGTHYPYGRVYYGGVPGYEPIRATQLAVESMEVQKPFMPDSTWLCVGHVDEFSTTIPDPTAPKGFRFVLADTRSAWTLLHGLDPDTNLPRYAPGGWSGHSIDTIGEIVNDGALRSLNDELQEILDEQKAIFVEELGLDEEDILYMPSLFEEPSGCGSWVAALIPGMANLIVDTVGDRTTVFLADPFMRSDVSDQASDPLISHVRDLFPDSMDLVFLDDWEVYHMGLGEVHCGSNVEREVDNAWWEDAGHLITQEVGR